MDRVEFKWSPIFYVAGWGLYKYWVEMIDIDCTPNRMVDRAREVEIEVL